MVLPQVDCSVLRLPLVPLVLPHKQWATTNQRQPVPVVQLAVPEHDRHLLVDQRHNVRPVTLRWTRLRDLQWVRELAHDTLLRQQLSRRLPLQDLVVDVDHSLTAPLVHLQRSTCNWVPKATPLHQQDPLTPSMILLFRPLSIMLMFLSSLHPPPLFGLLNLLSTLGTFSFTLCVL